ncbi:MAG: hypothetical protein V4601_13980 [Pseudomonadota bacterium]
MRFTTALTFWIATTGIAAAQPVPLPSVESVVVTGTKSARELNAFVGSIAVPTRLTGKLARWEAPICPLVTGVNPDAVAFITRRVRAVAAGAGAPVSTDPDCRANINIVFTTTPQALVDDIRRNQRPLLGYHDTYRQLGLLARVRRPVQAWYMTATGDARGQGQTDMANGGGLFLSTGANLPGANLPYAHTFATLGSRLGDGLRANLRYVTIVAEPAQLLEHEMGQVADYIAMLALSQMQRLDRCQSLPSITNLLAANCGAIPAGLSDIDLGYLRGLYSMNPIHARSAQVHQIITEIQHEVLKESD